MSRPDEAQPAKVGSPHGGAVGAGRAMTSSVGEMWDRRFAENGWPMDPDPFLVALAGTLSPGRGLDLGSGPGRNSLWLAAAGWEMTLIDASKVGLDQAASRAAAMGVDVTTRHADLVDWAPDEARFDLVIVANIHPGPDALADVLLRAVQAMSPGGHLYVVGHHVDNLGRHGPPDPDRLLTDERLRAALPALLEVEILETRKRVNDHGGREDRGGPAGGPGGPGGGPGSAGSDRGGPAGGPGGPAEDGPSEDRAGGEERLEGPHRDERDGGETGDDTVVVAWATKVPSPTESRR